MPADRRRQAGRAIPRFLAATVLLLFLSSSIPLSSAHQSAEHGTLDLRTSWTDVVSGDTPHFACDVHIGGNGIDSVAGMVRALQSPVDWFEFLWHFNTTYDHNGTEDGLLVEGGTDDTPPVDFVAGPLSYIPPGYYELKASVGEDWYFDNHSTPAIDFVVDGPCAPPVIPCPTDLAATLQPDGSIVVDWVDHPDSNGTVLLRAVTFQYDMRYVDELPAHTNTYHDTNTYSGATFYYQAMPLDPWGKECPVVSVSVPGERTYFPCPSEVLVFPDVEGVIVLWDGAEGTNQSKVYRAEGDGPMEHVYTSEWLTDFQDHNLTEGTPYTYTVTSVFAEGDSTGCPTASLEEGWTIPPPDGGGWPGWPGAEDGDGGGLEGECTMDVTATRGDDNVLLTWSFDADGNTTDIYRDASGDGEYEPIAHFDGAITEYVDTTAEDDAFYDYIVFVNVDGRAFGPCGFAAVGAIPNFPTLVASGLAIAAGAVGYALLVRRKA